MKYTRHNLKKLEVLCRALGYKLRYESGHFQAGHCRVEQSKLLIINKFFDIEGRISCLLELLFDLPVKLEELDNELRNEILKYRQIYTTQVAETHVG